MDRLEFKPDKTGIPVASGPNYSRLINIRNSVDTKADPNKGPYSSLFNYDQEEAALTAQNEKKQSVQKKIMRTNAIGDAFRLLIEGAGAFGGATITPRNVNPGILSAVNEYGKNDTEYMQRLEGLKTKKLALSQADLQYKLNQDAVALDKAEKQAERSHQESLQAEKELDAFIRENEQLERQYRLRGMENEREAARKNVQMGTQTLMEIELARKKAQFDRGWGLAGEGQPQFDLFTPSKPGAKNPKIPFILPDKPTMTVQLPPELIDEIRFQLIGPDGNKYDQAVPEALRAVLKNKKAEQSSLMQAIRENWPMIKEKMKSFAPNAYGAMYADEMGAEPSPADSTVDQQPTGVPAIEELQQKIFTNLTTDITLNLEDNKSVKKKIGELTDLIYGNYLLQPGNKKTKNDAVTEANKIITRYRQLVNGKVNAQ